MASSLHWKSKAIFPGKDSSDKNKDGEMGLRGLKNPLSRCQVRKMEKGIEKSRDWALE
jgi:hypothetical protein